MHTFNKKGVIDYTLDGVVAGEFKAEGKMNWLRVFNSGHYVAYFRKCTRRGSRISTQLIMNRAETGVAGFRTGHEGSKGPFDVI